MCLAWHLYSVNASYHSLSSLLGPPRASTLCLFKGKVKMDQHDEAFLFHGTKKKKIGLYSDILASVLVAAASLRKVTAFSFLVLFYVSPLFLE